MDRRASVRHLLLITALLALTASAWAQAGHEGGFVPQVGQEGKDVVWVPTVQPLVDTMLDLAKITPQDFLIDLGSGDGRTVISAAKRGTRALGVEYNHEMVELSRRNAVKEGVSDKVSFVEADLFETDLSRATVITMFLLPRINLKLRPRLLDLKPGTRIVSNTFNMGTWIPDKVVTVEQDKTDSDYRKALLWVVPARVAGRWKLGKSSLSIAQEFQVVSGSLKSKTSAVPIVNGHLNGESITFTVGRDVYSGRVTGSSMEGSVASGGTTKQWKAVRLRR